MHLVSVTVKYFAILREQSHLAEERMDVSGQSLEKIYMSLADKHGFTLPLSKIKAAVNDRFCDMDYVPQAEDRIVFIPPVAGG